MGKVVKETKRFKDRAKIEDIARVAGAVTGGGGLFGQAGGLLGEAAKRTGVAKTGTVTNPLGTVGGEAGEKLVDKPKALKKSAALAAKLQSEAQEATLSRLQKRQANLKEQAKAGKDLARKRVRQFGAGTGTGRASTIKSKVLGGSGETSRKSLLGL